MVIDTIPTLQERKLEQAERKKLPSSHSQEEAELRAFSVLSFYRGGNRLRAVKPLGKPVVCVEQNLLCVTQQPRQKGKEAHPMLSSSCSLADTHLVLELVPKGRSSLVHGKADGQNLPPEFAQRHISSVLMDGSMLAVRKDEGLAISQNPAEAALLEARVIGAWSSAFS